LQSPRVYFSIASQSLRFLASSFCHLFLPTFTPNTTPPTSNTTKTQSIVDAEWTIIYEKLDKCVDCGANIVLSRLPIGDLATQYFADRGLFSAGRVATDGKCNTIRYIV
jgi:chaperonin GroEL (HSP60 family)